MNPTPLAAQSALWAQLEALDLDGAAALSFSKRLARDNGWPLAFARRVVLEYKKFVYLAATCRHPVTPSDEVDQAWHLHLVYTRSYWDELCDNILGFRLHHGPTRGGAAEGQKFGDWYARTLASYQAAFGEAAPADIWPPAAVRFGEAPYFRRVNVRRQWLVPKPRLPLAWLRRCWPGLLAVAALLVLVGCTSRTPLNPFDWYGPEFLTLYWLLCATLLPLALWLQHRGRGPLAPYLGPVPDPYELARLADRGQLVADSALATLAYQGQLELLPEQRVRRTNAPAPTHPYEQTVWCLVPDGTAGGRLATVRQQALDGTLPALRALDTALEQRGLLLPPAERQRLDRLPLLTVLGLGVFGLVKVAMGLSRHRPVGFLLMSLFGLAVVASITGRHYRTWTSGQGEDALQSARLAVRRQRANQGLSAPLLVLSVALFGVAELRRLGMEALADLLMPPATYSGDSGGDGGSGCGSGCGGCGGCGS